MKKEYSENQKKVRAAGKEKAIASKPLRVNLYLNLSSQSKKPMFTYSEPLKNRNLVFHTNWVKTQN